MRRALPELDSALPLATLLPGMLAEDSFAQRLLAGCDEVLAPVLSVLDNITAYVDPALAPADLLDYLAAWVALPPGSSREHVAAALRLHGLRGTAQGLREELELLGVAAEIDDPGGVSWSASAAGALPPGRPGPVVVRVTGDTPALRAVVRDAVPAHLEIQLEKS